jgi:mannose-6-phosphate isomerase-like protein (cupin superfamily)
MPIVLALVLALATVAVAAAQAPAAQAPAVFITPAEIAQLLESGIVKSAVDQPIKRAVIRGGSTTVAMLHRDRAEAGALIHERATETYYILHGSGTITTGGSLGTPKPSDLTRLGAGPSLTGTREGGDSRRVGPGDIVIIPAGTVHSFSQLDSPISYLVFRFDPEK